MARPRPPQAPTTARGYGHAHRKRRAELLANLTGQTCPHCGRELRPDDDLHLDHTPDRTGYRGLAHARCNLSAAGRAAHGYTDPIGTPSRTW